MSLSRACLLSSMCLLPLAGLAAPLAAQDLPQHRVLATLDNGNAIVGSIEKPAGVTVRGPSYDQPPVLPAIPEDHPLLPGPPPEPTKALELEAAPSLVAPTDVFGPLAASDLVIKRDSTLTGAPSGYTSSVAEPSVGSSGQAIFQTYNWYAGRSSDNGATWSYVSPWMFAATGSFAGGFCCDQRVTQDSSRNLIIWSLQYSKTNSTASGTNGIRIAVAHGAADIASNTWQVHDFTPADFGATYASGYWFDYPGLAVSANYLYFTYNVFTTAGDTWTATVIGRVPLDALNANIGFTLDTFVTTSYFTLAPVSGATSTMLFASTWSATSIKVIAWPKATTVPTLYSVTGLGSTYFGTPSCIAFDGTNPCGRGDTRMQTGWITGTELGFSWISVQNAAAGRPYPFTRVAILDPITPTTVLSQPDLWNASYAFMYPAIAVNGRGHLGGAIDVLGGSQGAGIASTLLALVRDDYSAGAWATLTVATSSAGTASRWGDYNAAIAHQAYPNTWLIGGKVQVGGIENANSRVHNSWLLRSRDDPTIPATTITSISPSSGPTAGGTTVTITGTDFIAAATTVMIGGNTATGISVLSSTSLVAQTPLGTAGSATVSVSTVGGTASVAGAFTYVGSLFTDDPLQTGATTIKALHFTELRSRIDALRARYGLAAFPWTNPTLVPGATAVTATHLTELRTALQAVYVAAGQTPPSYADPTIISTSTTIAAVHISQIRAAVLTLW